MIQFTIIEVNELLNNVATGEEETSEQSLIVALNTVENVLETLYDSEEWQLFINSFDEPTKVHLRVLYCTSDTSSPEDEFLSNIVDDFNSETQLNYSITSEEQFDIEVDCTEEGYTEEDYSEEDC